MVEQLRRDPRVSLELPAFSVAAPGVVLGLQRNFGLLG